MHRLAARALAVVAALLLSGGLLLPWMKVPMRIVEGPGEAVRCEADQPRASIPFRAACLAFAATMAVGHLWHRRTSDRKAMLAGAFLAAQLLFPFAVMSLEPRLSAAANWLHIQHENLVWLGGDLHTNLEAGRNAWKEEVYLVDTPRQINVIRMPSSRLGAFQFGRLMTWFEALGYSNRFCQFVGRGWLAAVFGTVFLIVAECLPDGRLARGRVLRSLAAFAITLTVGLAAATIPMLLSASEIDRARTDVAEGRYTEADRHLERAARFLPALREDTFFVAQRGVLDFRRGRDDTPEGQLFHANLLERQGRYAQALERYQGLLTTTPAGGAVHREALRAVLRAAIHAVNGGRNDQGITLFEQVLREDPCNIKANYSLQLAYLRGRRRVELERLVARLAAVYRHFQMPTKAIVLSSSYENCMLAAYRDHDIEAATAYAAKVRKP
jgi:tetratricopeptide (TPR) repeat protein